MALVPLNLGYFEVGVAHVHSGPMEAAMPLRGGGGWRLAAGGWRGGWLDGGAAPPPTPLATITNAPPDSGRASLLTAVGAVNRGNAAGALLLRAGI